MLRQGFTPVTDVSLQVRSIIACSGFTQGPPLDDQPGQLCIPKNRFKQVHSLITHGSSGPNILWIQNLQVL